MITEDNTLTEPLTQEDFARLSQRAVRQSFALRSETNWDDQDDTDGTLDLASRRERFSTQPIHSSLMMVGLINSMCAISLFAYQAKDESRTNPISIGQLALHASSRGATGNDVAGCDPSVHTLPTSIECCRAASGLYAPVVSVPDEETHLAKSSMDLIDLTDAVLSDSRPMTDWEQKVTDDFFWSQFA